MVDRVKIYVKAGDGGSGCNSFKGKKFSRSWHPDGGSGGDGADIIIKVDKNIQDLEVFRFKQHCRAADGKSGQANKKKGAHARPYIINVPPGTIVRDVKDNLLLRDLKEAGQQFLVAKGGKAGRGNTRAQKSIAGLPGEEKTLLLELKLAADVAIVGYPNSGKSCLLNRISSAAAKVAAYPFTTASPFLGVLNFGDFEEPASLTCVEIPGLIKGAGRGKGLGAQFLRHAERAKILIHLIDMAAQEQKVPFEDYCNLNQELFSYSPQLAGKPQILVANKMDLPGAGANLVNFSAKAKKVAYPICALDGSGVKELVAVLRDCFRKG